MKQILILILVISTNLINAQINSSFVDVIFRGHNGESNSTEYTYCNGPGICISATIDPENEENGENDSEMHGRFYIDENTTLFLSFEKISMPLETIIEFFQNNNFEIINQYHLPDFVIDKLNINKNNRIIPGGIYPISESDDKTKIIVNFGSIIPVSNDIQQKEIKNNENNTSPPLYNFENENQ